ncbi:MAG: hypothetical protein GY950_32595, partial [bacterium]|nr:hypothetical protein [bacterium]
QASNLPKVKQTILSLEPMLQQQGIDLGQLLDSLDGMGYVLTLDPEKKGVIPMGKHSLEIPEPALALIFVVNNDSLFSLLKSKIPVPQKDPQPGKITIPVPPMPFDVAPLIVQKDGMLIVASNQTIVDAMFAAKRSGKGLTATGEFKRLSANIPRKGNSFRFGSAKLFQVVMDIQQKVIEVTGKKDEESKMAMDFMSMFKEKWGMFGVMQHGPEGYVYTMNHGFNLETLVLLPLSVPVGIVAAIAVPNMLTAVQKGKQKATMGDMKTIGLAIDSYMTDHNKAPEGKTLLEIKDKLQPFYIKTLPLKDAWGKDFHYSHGTTDNKVYYAIGSGGKNGVFKGWDRTEVYIVTTMKGFDKDIIFSNGKFTFGPKVK